MKAANIKKAENIGSTNIAEPDCNRNDTAQKGCQIFIDDIIVTQSDRIMGDT